MNSLDSFKVQYIRLLTNTISGKPSNGVSCILVVGFYFGTFMTITYYQKTELFR